MYKKLLAALVPLAFIISLVGGLVVANANNTHGGKNCQQQGTYQGNC